MTRDEFLYLNLKDNVSQYQVIFIMYAAAALAAAIMAVLAVAWLREYLAALMAVAMAAGFAFSAQGAKATRDEYAAALAEVGDDPTGMDTCRTYSVKTAKLIAQARAMTTGQFGAIWAYGIIAVMLYACSVVMFAISEGGWGFVALGALLIAMGVWLTVLAYKSFRNWRAAKQLNMLD